MMMAELLVLSLLGCPVRSAQPSVVYQDAGSDWAERYIQIPREQFSATVVRELVMENLRAFRSHRLVKIVIAADRQDILYMRRGKAMADYSYELWSAVLARRLKTRQPLAMALKIDGNVTVRYRDAAGISTESVLAGEDAFVVRGSHSDAKILHVSFSRVPYGRDGLVIVYFFVEVAGSASESTARAVARVLLRAPGIRERTLTIVRGDRWFIENEAFPVFYPFGEPEEPPSVADYVCAPTIICGNDEGEVACRQQGYLFGTCPRSGTEAPR